MWESAAEGHARCWQAAGRGKARPAAGAAARATASPRRQPRRGARAVSPAWPLLHSCRQIFLSVRDNQALHALLLCFCVRWHAPSDFPVMTCIHGEALDINLLLLPLLLP